MTTTNVYQGMSSDKNSSRVLQAPGGGGSGIFGHYQEESERDKSNRHQQDAEAVRQSIARGGGATNGDVSHNYNESKDSFTANRQRNQGDGAPFAVNNSLVSSGRSDRPTQQMQTVGDDYQTPQQQQAANRARNQGAGAPFATGDSSQLPPQAGGPAHHQQTVAGDYQTPQQRQANNPNKAGNSFSNLFGDSETDSAHGKAKGKVSTHNPVTWEANSNFDADQDHPKHRSRFENYASAKAGTFNPITGEDHVGPHTSTKVHAPPGGKSSIQF